MDVCTVNDKPIVMDSSLLNSAVEHFCNARYDNRLRRTPGFNCGF